MIATVKNLYPSNAGGEVVVPALDSTLWSPSTGQWVVLHTKSRQEKILVAELDRMGVQCFLPLLNTPRMYGNRKAVVDLPMFSGYVFLRGSVDDVYLSDRTKRVSNILWVHDQKRIDSELRNLALAMLGGARLDPFPALKAGVRAEVRSGPFIGVQGIVKDRLTRDRLILQIDILGRAVALELNGAILMAL